MKILQLKLFYNCIELLHLFDVFFSILFFEYLLTVLTIINHFIFRSYSNVFII